MLKRGTLKEVTHVGRDLPKTSIMGFLEGSGVAASSP